ncbi:MAG: PBECR4 domain-containing protein [Lachnospiraceae bacterium]|nr:PBECR4 domain-containing protein [Lachnospiraceae bacterium]
MDKIQEAAVHFLKLVNTTSYVFHLANRNVRVISLDFMMKDFHHLAGLQYLTDINIPRDKKNTLSWILDRTTLLS